MRVNFTALLRSAAGTGHCDVPLGAPISPADLRTLLASRFGGEFARLIRGPEESADVVLAVNGRVVRKGTEVLLLDQDEVTFLMPLAGG